MLSPPEKAVNAEETCYNASGWVLFYSRNTCMALPGAKKSEEERSL